MVIFQHCGSQAGMHFSVVLKLYAGWLGIERVVKGGKPKQSFFYLRIMTGDTRYWESG